MLFPVTGPWAAGEDGERASTPTARGAQTESQDGGDGTLRYPHSRLARQVSAAPSRPRRPGARLTPAPLLPPPGPRKAKFLSRPRQLLFTRLPALRRSRRLLRAAAVTGAGPRASRGPRTGAVTCHPGRETKAG